MYRERGSIMRTKPNPIVYGHCDRLTRTVVYQFADGDSYYSTYPIPDKLANRYTVSISHEYPDTYLDSTTVGHPYPNYNPRTA